MEYRTTGIILRRRNIGEADKLVTIFTLSRGKMVAKARGIRKVTSRQSGHLEPFYISSFHLVSGKIGEIITQALVEESFPKIYSDLSKVGIASTLVELVDMLTEDHQPVPQVFELLKEALEFLENNDIDNPSTFQRAFELKLMAVLGYRPELHQCVVGEEKYDPALSYHFSTALGGLICPVHQTRHPGTSISHQTITSLREMLSKPLTEIVTADQPTNWKEVDSLIKSFLTYHLDPRLKSTKVAKDLQR